MKPVINAPWYVSAWQPRRTSTPYYFKIIEKSKCFPDRENCYGNSPGTWPFRYCIQRRNIKAGRPRTYLVHAFYATDNIAKASQG